MKGAETRSGAGLRRRAAEAPQGLAVRRTAAAILRQVIERGTPLDALLDDREQNRHFARLDARDRALTRAILGAALRRRGEIEAALERLIERPLPPGSGALKSVLHVAAAQILFLDVPDHAAVSLAVLAAASDRRTGRARGLVNGVLRRLVRERDTILAEPDTWRLNTPAWLRERWTRAYGAEVAAEIARAHLTLPALDVSVKHDPAHWAERLHGLLLPTGSVRLSGVDRILDLPGYDEGAWWVQDAAAALPARLIDSPVGKRVVDLCAAPGGKTAELAAAGAEVVAVDISASRLARLAENLRRLRLTARLEQANILEWSPGETFDAVLLDAPCSATGTIRRHPDIAWLKRPEDIAGLASLQARMLARAAALTRPGGRLVYAVCSLEAEEGPEQVASFLKTHPRFRNAPIAAAELSLPPELVTLDGFLRTLPCDRFGEGPALRGMDGFFAARLTRD